MDSLSFSALQPNLLAMHLALSNLQNNISLRMMNSNTPYPPQLQSQLFHAGSLIPSTPSVLTKRHPLTDNTSFDLLQKKLVSVQPNTLNLNMLNTPNNLNLTQYAIPNSGSLNNTNVLSHLLHQDMPNMTQLPQLNNFSMTQHLLTASAQPTSTLNSSILQLMSTLSQTPSMKQESIFTSSLPTPLEKKPIPSKVETSLSSLLPSTSLKQKPVKQPETKPSSTKLKKDEKHDETKTVGSETEASSTEAKSPREEALVKVQALGDNISLNDMTKLFPDWDLITIFEYLSCGKNKEEFLKERQEKTERMRELAFLSVKKRKSKLKNKEGGAEKKSKKGQKKRSEKKKFENEDEAYY